MDTMSYLFQALGMSWVSGLSLYASVAVIGLLGSFGYSDLPPELSVLQSPLVIVLVLFLYALEFCAEKIPGLDSAWDLIHSFIRIPAGALIAAQAVAPVGEEMRMVAFLLGGAVAASSHGLITTTRLAVNASPEPFSNWAISLAKDTVVFAGLWLSIFHPYLMMAVVAGMVIVSIYIIVKLSSLAVRMAKGAYLKMRTYI